MDSAPFSVAVCLVMHEFLLHFWRVVLLDIEFLCDSPFLLEGPTAEGIFPSLHSLTKGKMFNYCTHTCFTIVASFAQTWRGYSWKDGARHAFAAGPYVDAPPPCCCQLSWLPGRTDSKHSPALALLWLSRDQESAPENLTLLGLAHTVRMPETWLTLPTHQNGPAGMSRSSTGQLQLHGRSSSKLGRCTHLFLLLWEQTVFKYMRAVTRETASSTHSNKPHLDIVC